VTSIKSRHSRITYPNYLSAEPLFKAFGDYLLLTFGAGASGFYSFSVAEFLLIFCDYNIVVLMFVIPILRALYGDFFVRCEKIC
jgi:hypothetical protein